MRVCVFFPFILDIKFVGRTSRGHTGGRSHRISHSPSFCVRALIFLARRIQPFLSLVDREVEYSIVYLRFNRSPPVGHFYFWLFFSFLVRKIPFAGNELTSQRVRGLRGTSELPGRPAFLCVFKIRKCLDLPSKPQSGGKMSKRLGGIIGCNTKSLHDICV